MSRRKQTTKVKRLPQNGTRRAQKMPKSSIWAQRETVDREAGLYGRARATRAGGSFRHYGMSNDYSHLSASDFLRGCRTYIRAEDTDARIIDPISKECVGTLEITDAMAYKIAALDVGVILEVHYDV